MEFNLAINEKLVLKLRGVSDREELFVLTDSSREHISSFLPWPQKIKAPSDSLQFIEKCQEKYENGTALDLGIFYENKMVGGVGFVTLDEKNGWGEIGYWISKEYEGKGIMTPCVKKIIEYGFKELSLHRIQIRCDSRNQKSKRIPEKLGFALEATLRESKKHEDGYSDGLIYGLLRNEWESKVGSEEIVS